MEIKINIGGLKTVLLLILGIIATAGYLVYSGIIDKSSFIIVIATLLGPILAVQIQVIREGMQRQRAEDSARRNEEIGRQRLAFRQMMAYRANPMDPLFVQALNVTPVDFKGVKTVEHSWKQYFSHLSTKRDEKPNWDEICNDRRCELLAAMANHLGYDFSLSELKDEKYMAEGYYNELLMKSEIIKGVHKIIVNGYPLTVHSFNEDVPVPDISEEKTTAS
ncbi:hypothetical protein AXW37_07175 [Yersinia ruckeri]|uniref:DUF6680 family protein n=1 Tax=Yersinia ruckeri TaxID=29486 RepID=UPI0008FD3E26|nr:DUF6680 family protein [Yersinia ruckeri]MCW6525120.1 hypothetical protein [Yersinia ruckeri]MCW6605479.1 hypothetical protein [Yersinia ruckeri]MDN0091327.1 hypothetical protein [Yersinia ruckeri]OIX45097.1 hypothetical protein AXW22_06935 [Yersinia ruckeri]OJB73036.1 hypothetical protein A9Q65_06920 [Yersinia ruckeri]